MSLGPSEAFFTQGTPARSVFYLHKGRVQLNVVSQRGKEATIALISAGEFFGEESLESANRQRLATAKAFSRCTALQIDREEMTRALRQDRILSHVFLELLLARTRQTQADLEDQLFNCSEKRLARILLLMARYGKKGPAEPLIPHITQETLANMVGTTRSRINFFMNRFRKLGFIEYKGRIHVHKELLAVILDDEVGGMVPISFRLLQDLRAI